MRRVLLITEGIGIRRFGGAQVVLRIMDYLKETDLLYKTVVLSAGEIPNAHKASIIKASKPFLKGQVIFGLANLLEQHLEDLSPDLIHIHGVFTGLQKTAVKVAKKQGIPTILSVHGMLEPQIWALLPPFVSLGKRWYWQKVLRPALRQVSWVHAITRLEGITLDKEFPDIPQVLIPNAIDLKNLPAPDRDMSPEKRIVFLGRLHPKKGVDLLIRAFASAHLESDWRLDIVGPDFDRAYSERLRELAAGLDPLGRISFLGPVYGEEKYRILQNAWVVIVPSYSEVVALVNLEAAGMGTPSITTTQTGLHDWQESGGLLIEPEVEALRQALMQAASWTLAERLARGQQARKFVEERYSWDVIGPRWVQAYQQIAGGRS
ncbi:glycosyltransferase [Candidatus Parcubacteria bacterium]|nr:MAG: glycosyltransferase [Candidatus Parcubacteria bacterium]